MRRPKAPRPAGSFDQRVAAVALVAVVIVMLCTVAVAHSPRPPIARRDPAAARDLVALMRVGERGTWSVTYDFVRTLADHRVLRQLLREARSPSLHVVLSGSSMTVVRGTRTYDCNIVENRAPCIESDATADLPGSEVVRVAVAAGAYDVTRRPSTAVAGERTRCFRLMATDRAVLPDLGAESDLCLAGDGVALSQRVVRSTGDVDEREARLVDRHATTSTIEALVRHFGPETAKGFP